MKNLWLIALLFLALPISLAQSAPNATASPEKKVSVSPGLLKAVGNYGGWWNSLSDEAKDNFLDGYISAMHRVQSIMETFAKEARNKLTTGPSFEEQMSHALLLSMLSGEFYYEQEESSMKNALNDFYKDPLNTRIPVFLAMGYVKDQLGGKKTAGQLLDELNDWRKLVNGK
jgi:hypothetical protein